MTFNLAANLETMPQGELFALQAALEAEIGRGDISGDRGRLLREHLERVDDEIITRSTREV